MARIVEDRVIETSTSVGAGDYTLLGATTGNRTFAGVGMRTGDTAYLFVEDINPATGLTLGGWECGIYTMSVTGTLVRTTIHASSNGGAAVVWAAGTRRIALSLSARQYKEVAAPDTRKMADWFAGGIDGKTVIWSGDSTTEQLGFQSFVNFDGNPAFLGDIQPALLTTKHYNYGKNGSLLQGFAATGSNGTNTAGYETGSDYIASLKADAYVISWGLNDMRGGINPGGAGSPLTTGASYPNFPNYRMAYGGAGQVEMALCLQFYMRAVVTKIKAANPRACIIFRMPNPLNTDCVFMANGVTPQQTVDVLRLAYRGDPALGVPNPETFGAGVLVYDSMATVWSSTAYSVVPNDLIESATDGLHPTVTSYRMILQDICALLAGPTAASIANADDARRATAYECALAHGWQAPLVNKDVLDYSGLYRQVFGCSMQVNNAFFSDMGFSGKPNSSDFMWGGAIGTGQASAAPTGLAVGDFILWGTAGGDQVRVVRDLGGSNSGAIRWYSGVDISGETLPSTIPPGTNGRIFRRIGAASTLQRLSAKRRNSGTPEQVAKEYRYAYPFQILSASNGSMTVAAIAGETETRNGRDASYHFWTAADMLCLAGVEGKVGGVDGHYGMPLTGATFTRSGDNTTIVLAGVDFRQAIGAQGVLLSNL